MKILHICHHFYPCTGGIESYVYNLCRNLIKLGHQSDVTCLSTCAYSKDKLHSYEKYDGINIYRVPYINLRLYNFAPTVLNRVKNYDIIHIHGIGFFSDFLALTRFIHKKPLVINTHSGVFHTKEALLIKNLYFNIWCRMLLRNTSFIADGDSDVKLFSKIASKIEMIPVGIDVEKFKKVKRQPNDDTLLYIGRIAKNKRVDNLINTFFFIKKKISGAKLLVVGRDWQGLRNDLEKMVKNKGLEENIVFAGEVSDEKLLDYLRIAKIYVFASEYEGGTVISVLEAMAAGCPVVIHNEIQETCKDFVIDNETGFIVDYKKPEEAAEKICELMNKDLSSVGDAAQKTAEKYDWMTAAKKFEAAYKKIV